MKKEYRKPQTEAIEMKTVGFIAGSNASTTTSFTNWDDETVEED